MRGHAVAVAVLIGLMPSDGRSQTAGIGPVPGITHTPLPASQLYPEVTVPPPPSPQPGGSHHGHGGPTPGTSGGDLFLARPDTYAPRYDTPPRARPGRPIYPTRPYAVGGYVPLAPIPVPERSRRVDRDERVRRVEGYLRLRVTPGTARVAVDGAYVGTVDEISSRAGGLGLEPGRHRLRIDADGFEPVTEVVEIVAGEFVTYARDLVRLSAPSSPPVAPATPKTFYVIPGCYAGDSPPRDGWLPDGCLAANVRTVPATLNRTLLP